MKRYSAIGIHDLGDVSQISHLTKKKVEEMEVVSEIYPFRTNEYVLNELINWDNPCSDPIFLLNFPAKEMLLNEDYDFVATAKKKMDPHEFKKTVHRIRMKLNPHPAGQIELNIPYFDSRPLKGIQHKYDSTILFFPSQGQTCHAYCTFCFRWPQFIEEPDLKIKTKEIDSLIMYLENNPQICEVLITGGDPMIMNARVFESYLSPLLSVKSLKNIRIGSKSLSFWPYMYTDEGSENYLTLFRKVIAAGKHLSFMAHFNHPVELSTGVVKNAIQRIRATGAEIRTQSPLLKHINDDAAIWRELWEKQVQLGCIPYYMFLARDTGAQHYFSVPLYKALDIYREAIRKISGLCRTARGPIMSTKNGKIEILDYLRQQDLYLLRFIQHRNSELTYQCFYAKPIVKDPTWFDGLSMINDNDSVFFN